MEELTQPLLISKRLERLIVSLNPVIFNILQVRGTVEKKKANFLDIAAKGEKITYLPLNRFNKEEDPYQVISKRVMAAPARTLKGFISPARDPWQSYDDLDFMCDTITPQNICDGGKRRLSMMEVSDQSWEDFSNRFVAETKEIDPSTLELVEGEAIRTAYHYNSQSVTENIGTLASSCMRYQECQKYFDLYVENPDKVKMLVYRDKDKFVAGRALVWTTDDGEIVMDRIYGSDKTVSFFRRYAQQQGWLYRRHNSYTHNTSFVTPDGQDVSRKIMLKMKRPEKSYFPYCDTFKFMFDKYNSEEIILSNYELDHLEWRASGRQHTLTSTNGAARQIW